MIYYFRCEIAIDLIEPVIVTKKSSSRSRRRCKIKFIIFHKLFFFMNFLLENLRFCFSIVNLVKAID